MLRFDPLLETSNIPYQDGLITVNGRSTLILWHGTPVEHDDPYGLAFDLLAGALSYIPYVGKLITDSNPVSNPPVVNADYVTFIEEAAVSKDKRFFMSFWRMEQGNGLATKAAELEQGLD